MSLQASMVSFKFIAKVTSMGEDRFFIQIPKNHLKVAKGLKGKYVKVFVEEVLLEDDTT